MFYSPNSYAKLARKMKKTDIMVFRVSSAGIKYSKPCCECIKTMKKFNIRRVYYSLDNGALVYEKISEIHSTHRSQMTRHLAGDF